MIRKIAGQSGRLRWEIVNLCRIHVCHFIIAVSTPQRRYGPGKVDCYVFLELELSSVGVREGKEARELGILRNLDGVRHESKLEREGREARRTCRSAFTHF